MNVKVVNYYEVMNAKPSVLLYIPDLNKPLIIILYIYA